VLQVSAAHVYLTYPFVLSWSLLEPMATGCPVIGSRTPPVEEVIRDRENGLLVDFFDREEMANRVIEALESPEEFVELREQAREEIAARFSRQVGLEGYRKIIQTSFQRQVVSEKAVLQGIG
jgi:glycosyltransferase involved in cell wall biosynthesis